MDLDKQQRLIAKRQEVIQAINQSMTAIENAQVEFIPESQIWKELGHLWDELESIADSIRDNEEGYYNDKFKE